MKRLVILLLTSVIGLAGCVSYTSPPIIDSNSIAPQSTTSWTLVDWKTSSGAQAFIPEKRPVTLQFHVRDIEPRVKEGKFSGFTGCNNIHGTYTETTDTLTLRAHSTTKQICEPVMMQMERAFVQHLSANALQKSFSRDYRGRLLLLTSTNGDAWTFSEGSVVQHVGSSAN